MIMAKNNAQHTADSPKLRDKGLTFLGKIETPWRLTNGLLLGCIGAYLVWLFLRSYLPPVVRGEAYYGIPVSITLLPAVPLILAAVGLFLGRRWSLVVSGVTLSLFLLLFLVIMASLIALGSSMTGQNPIESGAIYWLLLASLYILATVCLAFIYAKRQPS